MTITKCQFEKYLKVQSEGKYNMLDSKAVEESGLQKDVYMAILKNYDIFMKEYKDLYDKYMG